MINKAILVGRLGKDPELRALEGGAMVAKFSLATSESWKNKQGEWQEATEWHNIVVWGKTAEYAEKSLKKGDMIYCEGKIMNRSWDGTDGTKHYMTEIKLSMMRKFHEKGNNSTSAGDKEADQLAKDNHIVTPDDTGVDELPF